jgi:hypothetical protein
VRTELNDVDVGALAKQLPELRRAPAPAEQAVERRHWGTGLIATGGVLAGVGAVLTIAALPLIIECEGVFCGDVAGPGYILDVVAGTAVVLSVPFFAGGARRYALDNATRERFEEGRRVRPPRRGALAGGITMSIVGCGLLTLSWFALSDVYGHAALWVGSPLAIGGAIMAGAAGGRRQVSRGARVVPAMSPRFVGLAVSTSF